MTDEVGEASRGARLMVVVGEPSGDLHAARLLEQLNRRSSHFEYYGIGGARMRAQGFDALVKSEEMAVMGLVEILRHFPRLYGVLRKMRKLLQQRRPDLMILVDYPGFNLLLAKTAKRLGIPVLYYISPKIWVWRESRIHKIAARVDQMALIFPFEQSYYQRAGLPATYVGHPLVGQVSSALTPQQARDQLRLDPGRKTVGLFPGSRRGEVGALLPELLESARRLQQQNPEIQILLSQAPELSDALFDAIEEQGLSIHRVRGEVHTAIRACDAVVTASGTVTLEIALLNTPMVVIYRMAPLSYAILSRLIKTQWISLVNIVAQREVVPELLQQRASAPVIVDHLLPLLEQGAEREEMMTGLQRVREALGEGDSANRLADLVEEMVAA